MFPLFLGSCLIPTRNNKKNPFKPKILPFSAMMSLLVFSSKVDEFETLNADPYNSTLFKFAVYSSTPVLFLQTYEKKEVIPLYQVPTFRQTSTEDGEEIMVEVTDEDINDEVCTKIPFVGLGHLSKPY